MSLSFSCHHDGMDSKERKTCSGLKGEVIWKRVGSHRSREWKRPMEIRSGGSQGTERLHKGCENTAGEEKPVLGATCSRETMVYKNSYIFYREIDKRSVRLPTQREDRGCRRWHC